MDALLAKPPEAGCADRGFQRVQETWSSLEYVMSSGLDTANRPRQDFYSDTELSRGGWTDERVRTLLGNPDVLGVNPHYRNEPPIRFYLKDRVHRAEGLKSSSASGETSNRYVLDQAQLAGLLDDTISLFLEYQYKRGYEEPKARSASIQDMVEKVRSEE